MLSRDELVERAVRALGTPLSEFHLPETAAAVSRVVSLFTDEPVAAESVRRRLLQLSSFSATASSLPGGIPQRTPEWYSARRTMVTGSELSAAVSSSPSVAREYLRRKVADSPPSLAASSPAVAWGVLYEPVACRVYELRTGAAVKEFGLLVHPTIKDFGASPDGITDLGIMIEIKCPYSRPFSNSVPAAYMTQIQAQLDTAGLLECDYVECRIEQYASREDFLADSHPDDPSLTSTGTEKGGIVAGGTSGGSVVVGHTAEGIAGAILWKVLSFHRIRVKKQHGFVERLAPSIEVATSRIRLYDSNPGSLDEDFPPIKRPGHLAPFAFIRPASPVPEADAKVPDP